MIPNDRERYTRTIQPVIGGMLLKDIKPLHYKMVLNQMENDYAGSAIRQTYIAMGTMLKSAVMNGLIAKHPMDGVRYTKPVRAPSDIKFLTADEQQKFMEPAKNSSFHTHLYKVCDEAGIKRFCMHALRHTCSARAVEGGMQQKLLGHASIKTTMDRYVHVPDDSMAKAVLRTKKIEMVQQAPS